MTHMAVLIRGWIALLTLLVLAAPLSARAAPVRTENVEVELVSAASVVAPGQPFYVALHKQIREHWHTYWRNPGDAGLPTELHWELPEGFTAGDIVWPAVKPSGSSQ